MTRPVSIDELIKLTGGFGKFQWRLVIMMAYCMTTLGLQGLTMTFIAYEPAWKCASNSSSCNTTEYFKSGMKQYTERCHLKTEDWTYDTSFNSIVTQVFYI